GVYFVGVDHQPVKLVWGVAVPADATEQHLKILASLAQTFSEAGHRNRILEARDVDSLFNLLA
ncbi:MAG: PTS sugar transporter subunit IIA, partial [Pseudomonadota bacterium]|nr:PTS sugar transporter subunit IIA [Pseudomonadota bacterium]